MARNVFTLLLTLCTLPLCAATTSVSPLSDGWRIQSACQIQADGAAISVSGFSVDGWPHATVPSTVLAAQVADKVFPDPYFAMNLRNIPGATYPLGHNFAELPVPEDSPYHCGWWYRVEFTVPAARDRRTTIHFGGINYRGDVWVNGHRIADSTTVAGAYRTYDFDVTDFVKPGSANVLAVEAFAPSDKDLGINWVDWNPAPPDKDMGLWGDVNLVTTGSVTLRSPMAVTHFPDESLKDADLTVYAELHNGAGHPVRGVVSGTAAGVQFQEPVELAADEEKTVVFTPEQFPALRIHNPKPWWPNQMGDPHLEHLSMSFSEDGVVSDTQSVDFGIREITSELTANGSRLFRINGKPILMRGAGWSPDMLLRNDPARLRDQISLVRDMNLNTIRLEGKLETEDFFRLTDREGILVMLGWCCCDHWEHWKDWTPHDLDIAKASLHDQMLRLRSHASLLVWLNGSDNAPPANVEKVYLQVEDETHWPNPTLAAASAANTLAGHDGVKMSGPYDYVPPSYWYVDQHNGGNYGFNTETSPGPAIPSLASRQKFLSDPDAWPPTADWSYHNGGGEFTTLKVMDEAIAAMYATPSSAADYERMAQTMAYDSERAMFEAYSKNKYFSTGVIQWMLNNAWPSMIWHLYDYYLDADAGYFAAKKACEPIHIQYSYDDRTIVVVNSTYNAVRKLHATVQVHGIHWNDLYHADAPVNAAPDSSQQVFSIPDSLYSGKERIFFIDLTLTDADGHIVSRNFYWVPYTLTSFDWNRTDYTHTPAERYADLTALANLPKAQVEASADIEQTSKGRRVHLHLHNTSSTLAFQLSAAVRTQDGGLIAPVYWSDNWIELTPGESVTLTARLPGDAPATPAVLLQGWNIAPVSLTPSAAPPGHPGD
ncbi:MAG TPA: glycosyl hydrolase family 2 [Acidobacteriaceae bacterium]|jgi:exo-1,4-beta-D-glucosaminidase|nr:glycosyl hydrolase family 2 [Acidobacteriaceae bacterium]